MMKEIYKTLEGHEGIYQVSNLGNVKSFKRYKSGKLLTPYKKGSSHYLQVALSKNNEIKYLSVHRLVAIAFIKNPKNKSDVNHIDNNPSNNVVSNLEWCTPKENTRHSVNQMRHNLGERNGQSKLKERDVIDIRSSSLTQKELATKYKVPQGRISIIKNCKSWKHI